MGPKSCISIPMIERLQGGIQQWILTKTDESRHGETPPENWWRLFQHLPSSYEISDIRMICRKCPDLQSTPSTQATPNSTVSSPQESNHGFLDTSSLYLKESSQVHRSRIGGIQGYLSMCIYTAYCIAAVGVCIYEHVCMHIYIYLYQPLETINLPKICTQHQEKLFSCPALWSFSMAASARLKCSL